MKLNLTALGIVNALGADAGTVAARLFHPIEGPWWQAGALTPRTDIVPGATLWVGAVTDPLPEVPPALHNYACRNNQLALAALLQMEAPIAAAINRYGAERIAVILGTSTSGMAEGEAGLKARQRDGVWPNGFAYSQQEPGNLALFVADLLALRGPAYTVHTACSSSGKAIASAQRLIRAGLCDAAIVGGADSLCGTTLHGFFALEALSQRPLNAFSANRDGTCIGEGAALFLLEPAPGPVGLLGAGESSDAHHISAPEPEGRGARAAMNAALQAAGLAADAVGYVNMHGTGTKLNDAMEGRAVTAIFGADMPCSATKVLTGHTLGAAAATEAAFCWMALQRGLLPPHLWDGVAADDIPPLRLAIPGEELRGPRTMLSASYAFGGSNLALLLGAA
jgi:3-oxoacyl-[acyl-carrier-protein] synthase-1